MLSRLTARTSLRLAQRASVAQRGFAASSPRLVEAKEALLHNKADSLGVAENEERGLQQAPNRAGIWSRSQKPRAQAMSGPRFEQTDFDLQPQSQAAIELIHRQPVRWTHDKVVACDGGGGPAGHPRVFINTDKAEITPCGYCGLPYANEHHREHLEALPETSYPLA
ncbi:zinc-finger domain-containing protein [Pestalotiopsis sp. NC0098]|nr:zinc-finger domain-containing protein [Pestalotiopsis sp. NC0098]